jgi:D-glycero-D-manno-heptose 1,7-bisphosphate phosphatase
MNPSNKCIFLDRDGVLNEDRTTYVYRPADFIIPDGVVEALRRFKAAGYMLIVVTNQAGIAKGIYSRQDVMMCHHYLQEQCGYLLDDIYLSPHHPDYSSQSLTRKPDSLMLEKAMAKYDIDPARSWMIGDRYRDVQAGQRAGVHTVQITDNLSQYPVADRVAINLLAACSFVLDEID